MMYALWEQKPQKYDCTLCYDGGSKIRYISGMNMQSKYACYDIGRVENVKFCPRCGRKLKEREQE